MRENSIKDSFIHSQLCSSGYGSVSDPSVLVRIRILILGYPLNYGSGSCPFLQGLSRCQKKNLVFLLFWFISYRKYGTVWKKKTIYGNFVLTDILKKSKNFKNQLIFEDYNEKKCVKIKFSGIISVLLTHLRVNGRIRNQIRANNNGSGSARPEN